MLCSDPRTSCYLITIPFSHQAHSSLLSRNSNKNPSTPVRLHYSYRYSNQFMTLKWLFIKCNLSYLSAVENHRQHFSSQYIICVQLLFCYMPGGYTECIWKVWHITTYILYVSMGFRHPINVQIAFENTDRISNSSFVLVSVRIIICCFHLIIYLFYTMDLAHITTFCCIHIIL